MGNIQDLWRYLIEVPGASHSAHDFDFCFSSSLGHVDSLGEHFQRCQWALHSAVCSARLSGRCPVSRIDRASWTPRQLSPRPPRPRNTYALQRSCCVCFSELKASPLDLTSATTSAMAMPARSLHATHRAASSETSSGILDRGCYKDKRRATKEGEQEHAISCSRVRLH